MGNTYRPKTHPITINTSVTMYNEIKKIADAKNQKVSEVALPMLIKGMMQEQGTGIFKGMSRKMAKQAKLCRELDTIINELRDSLRGRK